MKPSRLSLLAFGALSLLAAQPVSAAQVDQPDDGDIFLGIRASGGQGGGVSLLVNVGNDATFRNAAAGETVPLINIQSALTTVFGAEWHTRANLHWAFFGARNTDSPTVYSTRAQDPVGRPTSAFPALSLSQRTATKNQIISVTYAYEQLDAISGDGVTAIQSNANNTGSYNYQVATEGTTDFGSLSGWLNIEGSSSAGLPATVLDFFRYAGSTTEKLGTFTISNSGDLTFTKSLGNGVSGIHFASVSFEATEDGEAAVLTVLRTNDIEEAATATFSTVTDGTTTAVAGTDFVAQTNVTVSFDAGEYSKTISIPLINRAGLQANRTFKVSLASPSEDAILVTPTTTTVTIVDVDSEVTFAAASINERSLDSFEQPNVLNIVVNRNGFNDAEVSVDVSATGGTLINGTHYTLDTPVTLSFAKGESSKVVSIPLNALENELLPGTIVLTLANLEGDSVLGSVSSTTVNVLPNTGTIAFAEETIHTATGALLNVGLVRSNGSLGEVSVVVTATGGTLTSGTHYQAFEGVVTFAAGATEANLPIQFLAISPDLLESGATLTLSLSDPTNHADLGDPSSTTITAYPNPGAFTFAAANHWVTEESGSITLTILRNGGTTGETSVTVNTVNGTAVAPEDFTAITNHVVYFADGNPSKTVNIPIANTKSNEPNETFSVVLSAPTGGATLGSIPSTTVVILDKDKAAPSITVLTPKANAKILESSGPTVAVTGTVKDNKGVAKLEVQINGGEFVEVTLGEPNSKGVSTFSTNVTAEPGTNTLVVRATDHRDNAKLVTRSFTYADPYPAIAGTYVGLVTAKEGTSARHYTEGLITIKVVKKGTFSGKLVIDGSSLSFSGRIPPGGKAQFGKALTQSVTFVRKGKPNNLQLALDFDLAKEDNTQKVIGTLTDGTNESELVANRSLYTSKKNPVAPFSNVPAELIGSYTVLFEASAEGDVPRGDGWASAKVSSAGAVKVSGKLADGTTITYSGPLSRTNELPLYAALYSKKGSVSGPVQFNSLAATTDLTGTDLFWFRPADSKSKVYPAGWESGITLNLEGSKFVKSAKKDLISVLGFNGSGRLQFQYGGLIEDVFKDFSIASTNKTTLPDKTFKLTVSGSAGTFSGTFNYPDSTKKPAFKGVILQKSGKASGYFLSPANAETPNKSGKVVLTEQVAP